MPFSSYARHDRKWWYGAQPQSLVEVDQNGIAQGALIAIVPSHGFVNLVDRSVLTNASVSLGLNAEGRSVEPSGSTSSYIQLPDVTVTDYTFLWLGNVPAAAGVGGGLAQWYYDNFPTTPRQGVGTKYAFGTNTTISMEAYVGGTGSSTTFVDSSGGRLVAGVWAMVRSGTNVALYNPQIGTGGSVMNVTVGSGSQTLVNGYIGVHFFSSSRNEAGAPSIAGFFLIPRALTADEVFAMQFNPWAQLLKEPKQKIILGPPALTPTFPLPQQIYMLP